MRTTPAAPLRVLVVLLGACLVGPACRCAPAAPTPVTFRVKNTGRDPLFVRDTKGQLGLTVQRNVNGTWFPFDDLPCDCLSCERICERSCRCPDGGVTDLIRAVPPNGQVERSWDGVIQVAGFSCGQVCLVPENAPPDETFQLQLCFVNQIDGLAASPDGGRVSGAFPPAEAQTCVTRQFAPQQGVVEISPVRGADCSRTSDCKGKDELCLGGSCTSGCPLSSYPPQAELFVTATNMGFFTETRDADAGVVRQAGQGRLLSTQFSGETLQLTLSNAGGTGRVDVKLPGGLGGPSFAPNADVRLTVVAKTRENRTYRGVLVRSAATDELLFAADTAVGEAVLSDSDLSPFQVRRESEAIGCRLDSTCGKLVFVRQSLAIGSATVAVEPGKLATLTTTSASYRFWNVTAGQYGSSSTCDSYRPYALWKETR